jgi:hypothetical protein
MHFLSHVVKVDLAERELNFFSGGLRRRLRIRTKVGSELFVVWRPRSVALCLGRALTDHKPCAVDHQPLCATVAPIPGLAPARLPAIPARCACAGRTSCCRRRRRRRLPGEHQPRVDLEADPNGHNYYRGPIALARLNLLRRDVRGRRHIRLEWSLTYGRVRRLRTRVLAHNERSSRRSGAVGVSVQRDYWLDTARRVGTARAGRRMPALRGHGTPHGQRSHRRQRPNDLTP